MSGVGNGIRLQYSFLYVLFVGTTVLNTNYFQASSWYQKWLLIFFLCLSLSIWSLRIQKLYIPRLNKLSFLLVATALIGFSLSLLFNWGNLSWIRLAERVSFFMLFLYFFQLVVARQENFYRHLRVAVSACLTILLGTFLLNLDLCDGFSGGVFRDCSVPYFQNRNMFAQALVLHFLILISTLTPNERIPSKAAWAWAGSALTLVIVACFVLHTRSVLFGLALFISAATFVVARQRLGQWSSRILFASVAIVTFTAILWRFSFVDDSSYMRVRLAKNAVQIANSHVAGVGLGNFPWANMSYEKEPAKDIRFTPLFKSPHNEFLRMAAEEGWITAFSVYLLILYGFWRFHQQARWSACTVICLLGFLTFFVGETSFQFPFENPFPTLSLAYAFALFTSHEKPREISLKTPRALVMTSVVALLLAVIFLSQFYFLHGRKRYGSNLKLDLVMCRLNSDYWPLCIDSARMLAAYGRKDEAQTILRFASQRQPNNYQLSELVKTLGNKVPER